MGFDREAARERCEAATPGDWTDRIWEHPAFDDEGDPWCSICPAREEDYMFIVHARTDLPAALDEIERLRGLLAQAECCCNRTCERRDAR